MCGISASVVVAGGSQKVQNYANVKSRGPDGFGVISFPQDIRVASSDSTAASGKQEEEVVRVRLELAASLLHLQGESPITQPLQDIDGNVLLWNGEVFGGNSVPLGERENDTRALLNALHRCLEVESESTTEEVLSKFLGGIQGPWSCIFWHKKTRKLYFGRDMWGRRSLLMRRNKSGLTIASVSTDAPSDHTDDEQWVAELKQWEELPVGKLWAISFSEASLALGICEQGLPLREVGSVDIPLRSEAEAEARKYMSLALQSTALAASNLYQHKDGAVQAPISVCPHNILDAVAFCLLQTLSEAIRRRVTFLPRKVVQENVDSAYVPARVALLFSGGLDSMVLAALTHLHVNDDEPIDLINVCFDSPHHNSPDRQTAIEGFRELAQRFPHRLWQLICVNEDPTSLNSLDSQYRVLELLSPCITRMDYSIGAALWFASRGRGSLTQSRLQGSASNEDIVTAIRRMVVAGLCSFASVHNLELHLHPEDSDERLLEESLTIWHSVAGLPEDTANGYTEIHSKGEVECSDAVSCSDSAAQVETTSKVLLSGIGADEQLGGYGRHATAYKHRDWEGLRQEMDKDILRLWKRNLGRDDRVISSNSREIRAPFLDEDVAHFIAQVDLPIITDPRLPRGAGDKRILRRVATLLQIPCCSSLQKRAIQFGSRVARKCNEAALGTSHRKACGSDEYHIVHPS
eukprot:gb/GECG01006835.1/.p1 GENE.gb/GECG01006835.1/~~gb/GECG01006835.1/.p1  ORF type:complete len:692 (+),score=72.15 gb/GECG01006835.1/:1-2076(+)